MTRQSRFIFQVPHWELSQKTKAGDVWFDDPTCALARRLYRGNDETAIAAVIEEHKIPPEKRGKLSPTDFGQLSVLMGGHKLS